MMCIATYYIILNDRNMLEITITRIGKDLLQDLHTYT